jgi:protein tyrosine phosphatase (PTP) superfamily phosphohydrolase (DUF442 family)
MRPSLASLFSDHAILRLGWRNWAAVIPGRVFRSNHPTPGQLARAVSRFGLRSIVNLRGTAPNPSTSQSAEAAARLGVDHIYMAFESRGAPHRVRILRFHELYRTMNFPILLHCKSGADRAGLAAGLVVLFEGGTAAAAARQLSWRHLHVALAPTGILDAFFRLYAAEAEGRKPFLDWVREDYDEAELRRRFRPWRLGAFLTDTVLRRE